MTTWEDRMAEKALRRALIRAAQPTEYEHLQARWRAWVGDRYGWDGKIAETGEFLHAHHAHEQVIQSNDSGPDICSHPLVDARTGLSTGRSSDVLVLRGSLHEGAPCLVCADFNPEEWTL